MYTFIHQDEDGVYRVCSSPSWIHSDVMDDNIHMEHCSITHCTNQAVSDVDSTSDDAGINVNIEGNKERWYPAHVIDFGDLLIGEFFSFNKYFNPNCPILSRCREKCCSRNIFSTIRMSS